MVIFFFRTSVNKKSSPDVALSTIGFAQGFNGSLNVPIIEPKVSFSCEIRPEKAVLHASLIKSFWDNLVKKSFNSVPSPDANWYSLPSEQAGSVFWGILSLFSFL